MKQHWLWIGGILAVSTAAALLREPAIDQPTSETPTREVSESAVAAVEMATPQGEATPSLPPGHPPIAGETEFEGPTPPNDAIHQGLGTSTTPDKKNTKPVPKPGQVERAQGPNGVSIAELFKRRKQFDGKRVRVRGQVVKVVEGVMKTNFVHLRDGTGDAATKNHDLTVTMAKVPVLGRVVTVEGQVKTDHDLGAGYLYAVLLEQASTVKEPRSP